MSRTRSLKAIAIDMSASFVSLNNKFNNKWALGYLFDLAENHHSNHVSIDLIQGTISPHHETLQDLCDRYVNMLCQQIESKNVSANILNSASLKLSFDLNRKQDELTPFSCEIILTDYLGKIHIGQKHGSCFKTSLTP